MFFSIAFKNSSSFFSFLRPPGQQLEHVMENYLGWTTILIYGNITIELLKDNILYIASTVG